MTSVIAEEGVVPVRFWYYVVVVVGARTKPPRRRGWFSFWFPLATAPVGSDEPDEEEGPETRRVDDWLPTPKGRAPRIHHMIYRYLCILYYIIYVSVCNICRVRYCVEYVYCLGRVCDSVRHEMAERERHMYW